MTKRWLLVFVLAGVLAGCGFKGDLKTPSQIAAEEEKKAKKEAEEKAKSPPQEPAPQEE